jgi:hypothetical protein
MLTNDTWRKPYHVLIGVPDIRQRRLCRSADVVIRIQNDLSRMSRLRCPIIEIDPPGSKAVAAALSQKIDEEIGPVWSPKAMRRMSRLMVNPRGRCCWRLGW